MRARSPHAGCSPFNEVKMPIPQITYQLPLDLDLPAPEEEGGVGQDEARQRSEASRKILVAVSYSTNLDVNSKIIRGLWA